MNTAVERATMRRERRPAAVSRSARSIEGSVMADQQGTPPSPDRVGFYQPFIEVAERSQLIVNEWLSRSGFEDVRAATAGSFNIANLFIELTSQIMTIPATIVSAQMSLWQ